MDSTLIQKLLLLVLLAASLLIFLSRLGRVLLILFRAKSERGFRINRFWRRCWVFFWEVCCQAKVIRDRPLPGLAHAFLLWGFCAFLPAEVDHLLSAFGTNFVDQESSAGLFYFWFVFLFALFCTVSIAGLAFRRYIVESEWLDPISLETNLTLALIFLIMITLLPRWWMADATTAGRVLWWIHTIALLVLIPLIPHAKNRHLIFTPFALSLKRDAFGEIPPLDSKRDPGLLSGHDITRLTALQAYSCVECGRCTEQCPAYATGKELDPRLIALGINYYLDEYGPRSSKPILERSVSPKAIFECTTCGACETHCPSGIQHLSMIVGLRRGAMNNGWKDQNATRLFDSLSQQGNAMGLADSQREKFISWAELPAFDGSQEYCLWLGCMGAYDPRGRIIVSSFARVMKHLGTSFGVLSREYCSGDPARRLGNEVVASQLANVNLRILREAGVRKIVSICPHCVRTMGEDWSQVRPAEPGDENLPLDATVEHHSEFLARHADLLRTVESGQNVTFHDPCYLGRYRNVYEDPRRVIGQTSTLVEPARTRDRSFCCGAGGGLAFLGEQGGRKMSIERANELVATGADVVATACPFCSAMFQDVQPQSTAAGAPQFLDIAQIVAQQLAD